MCKEKNSGTSSNTVAPVAGPLMFGRFTVEEVDSCVDELEAKKCEDAEDRSKELHQFLFTKICPRTDKSFNDQLKKMNNMGLEAPGPEDQEEMLKTLKMLLEGIVLLHFKKNLTKWNETDDADAEKTSSHSLAKEVAGTKKRQEDGQGGLVSTTRWKQEGSRRFV